MCLRNAWVVCDLYGLFLHFSHFHSKRVRSSQDILVLENPFSHSLNVFWYSNTFKLLKLKRML